MVLTTIVKNMSPMQNGVRSQWSGQRYLFLEEKAAEKYKMVTELYGVNLFAMDHVWVWYQTRPDPDILSKTNEEIDKYLIDSLYAKLVALNTLTGELEILRTTFDIKRWAGLDA